MTDGPRPSEPSSDPQPDGSDKRRPLRQRIADNWNSLGPADKARAIGVAAAMIGGFIALAYTRAMAAERKPDDPDSVHGLSDVALILGPAATEQDDTASFGAPQRLPYSGPVRGYRRYQCLNPCGHADGNCTHKYRWVPDHTRGPADERLRVG